jgi:hypothetical protein
VVGGDVVGGGFSPGLVAAEAALGGALHETEFGPFSAEFGVLDVLAVGHRVLPWWCGCGAAGRTAGSSPGLRPVRNDRNLLTEFF